MSYHCGDRHKTLPLIQLSHMLTLILSALSKAAGALAITFPLLRLHVAWGLKEIEMRLCNHKGKVTEGRTGHRDQWTDQAAPREVSATHAGQGRD